MDAVCFDMDGVLVDSEDFWVPWQNDEVIPRVVPEADARAAEITGMHYHEMWEYFDSEYETAMSRDEFLQWFDETARVIYGEDVDLLEGTHDMVDDLRQRGVPVALASSSRRGWIDIVVERFDLDMDAVVSAGDLDGPGKPAPDIYEHAAERLGVDPADAVAVEDSGHGIEAARRAGMYVVGFKHGQPDDVDRSDADYLARSVADLRTHLFEQVDG